MSISPPLTIAVVTGTRAEFGLLEPIMRAIDARPDLSLKTIVIGVHLRTGTWRDVEAAGFHIDAKVEMQRPDESGRLADAAAVGRGVEGIAAALSNLETQSDGPGVVLVLGDRVEAMAGAIAGSVGGWRVAHVHGGDRAEGVADEAMRHAISKLSHLHFAATAMSRERLIRMGEPPETVWNVGSPAMDILHDIQAAEEAPNFIVIQHPIGESDAVEAEHMMGTLRAVMGSGRRVMVMSPNADAGHAGIRRAIREAGVEPVGHLPRRRFLSLLAGAEAMVGNSSAGLIEAAGLGVPCVNIGPRQAGRERANNSIDCDYGDPSVARALQAAMRLRPDPADHPYGDGHAGERVATTLAEHMTDGPSPRKRNTY